MTTASGTLAGIARHARRRGPMETIDGDFRGDVKSGGRGRRQVTPMESGDRDAALREVGRVIPWWERRANLLVDERDLPKVPGVRLLIGVDVVGEITRETDPCVRMEVPAAGLCAALAPDRRGGVCTRVKMGGIIAVGDSIRIATA